MLALPVPNERLIKPGQVRRAALAQHLMPGMQAADGRHPTGLGNLQHQQTDIGRRVVEAIIRVPAQVLAGQVRAHPNAGLLPGVVDVVQQRSLERLRDGAGDHLAEQPIQRQQLALGAGVDRQSVDHGEPDPVIQRGLHGSHESPARREAEIIDRQGKRGDRVVAHGADGRLDLRKACSGQCQVPIAWGHVLAVPGGVRGQGRAGHRRDRPAAGEVDARIVMGRLGVHGLLLRLQPSCILYTKCVVS